MYVIMKTCPTCSVNLRSRQIKATAISFDKGPICSPDYNVYLHLKDMCCMDKYDK